MERKAEESAEATKSLEPVTAVTLAVSAAELPVSPHRDEAIYPGVSNLHPSYKFKGAFF